jgi:hypothetical protein
MTREINCWNQVPGVREVSLESLPECSGIGVHAHIKLPGRICETICGYLNDETGLQRVLDSDLWNTA